MTLLAVELVLLLCSQLCCSVCASWETGPIINTTYGSVQGIYRQHPDGEATLNYLGIPFAQPPVGNLRFLPPQAHGGWQPDVFQARQYGATCPQLHKPWQFLMGEWLYDNYIADLVYDENCLSLNIFTPANVTESSRLPVLFWLYGGGFLTGFSAFQMYEGDWLALRDDVIIVTSNYRLGILGFLTTADSNAPGNVGLLDQVLALSWTKDNIARFGGDPNRITLFGESAGGLSASYHILSPMSRELFRAAVCESGVITGTAVLPENVLPTSQKLATDVGCPTTNPGSMLECLRLVPEEELTARSLSYEFPVVKDGVFVTGHPDDLWTRGHFHRGPLIIGANNDDGSGLFYLTPWVYDTGINETAVNAIVAMVVGMLGYQDNQADLHTTIKNEYFSDPSHDLSNVRAALDMFRDYLFLSANARVLGHYNHWGVSAYQYYFTHRPCFQPVYTHTELGAGHGDEMAFVFNAVGTGGILQHNSTVAEQRLADSVGHAWIKFACDGTPEFLDTSGAAHTWPEHDEKKKLYLLFSAGNSSNDTGNRVQSDILPGAMAFWNEVIPCIGEPDHPRCQSPAGISWTNHDWTVSRLVVWTVTIAIVLYGQW